MGRRRRHDCSDSEQAKRRRLNLAECERGMMIQPLSDKAIWAVCYFERYGDGYHLTQIHQWCKSAVTARGFVGVGWQWTNFRIRLVMRAPFFSRIKLIDWRAS